MHFDATSLYPPAMRDEKSNYPKNETDYAFTPDMSVEIVGNFKIKLSHKVALF